MFAERKETNTEVENETEAEAVMYSVTAKEWTDYPLTLRVPTVITEYSEHCDRAQAGEHTSDLQSCILPAGWTI